MSFLTRAVTLAGLAQLCVAGYTLQDDYTPSNFFSMWEFFTAPDPTHGFVNYVDQGTAQAAGLISASANSITMGVDSTNIAPNGRNSVRLTSNKVYNHGLIVLDVAHMPEGCGTWPAFWTVGPSWPTNGEIDIIEGVNDQISNAMTLHTGPSCGITDNGLFAGSIVTPSCDVAAFGQAANAGCSIKTQDTNTYGAGLNAIQGGVYATEWTSEAISIYFFPRSAIPSDITSGKPTPSSWGKPLAQFQGGCDIDSNIKDQQLVFDTTFCGDWAGNVWSQSSTCSAKASSCEDYVANNPSAFQNAYWEINSLKVYQDDGLSGPEPPVASTDAGPTGIATGLPSQLSTLAPIPISTQDIHTTFIVSVKPTSSPVIQTSAGPDMGSIPSIVIPNDPSHAESTASSALPSSTFVVQPLPSSTVVVEPEPTSTFVPQPDPTSTFVEPSSAPIEPTSNFVAPTSTFGVQPAPTSTFVVQPEPVTSQLPATSIQDEPCDGEATVKPVASSPAVYTAATSLPVIPSAPVYTAQPSSIVQPAPVYTPSVEPASVYTPPVSTAAAVIPTYTPTYESSADQDDPQITAPDEDEPCPDELEEGEPLLASWFPDGDDVGGIPTDVMPADWEETHRTVKRHADAHAEAFEPLLRDYFPSGGASGGIPPATHEVSAERTRRFERRMLARNARQAGHLRHFQLHSGRTA